MMAKVPFDLLVNLTNNTATDIDGIESGEIFGNGFLETHKLGHDQLSMGNLTLMNVKAGVISDANSGGLYRPFGLSDGLLGLREMLKYGMVLDLSNHLILAHPGGQMKGISGGIRSPQEALLGNTEEADQVAHLQGPFSQTARKSLVPGSLPTGMLVETLSSKFVEKGLQTVRSGELCRGWCRQVAQNTASVLPHRMPGDEYSVR